MILIKEPSQRRARTPKQISYNMSRVRAKNSQIELTLRRTLHRAGLRYQLHFAVEGKPDIAFPRQRVAVFCDSAFWHGYRWGVKAKRAFKSNREFWIKKIERNRARDRRVNRILRKAGWTVLRFWDHQIEQAPEQCCRKIMKILRLVK